MNSVKLHEEEKSFSQITEYLPEHKEMVAVIKQGLPEIRRASSLFFKSQSQFMDNMLTVSHPTPIRNLRQILAEMNRVSEALREAHFKTMKNEVRLKMKERSMSKEVDDLRKDMIEIEILELQSKMEVSKGYISGAIRTLASYTKQYDSIVKAYNLENFNEVDFEKEEERYHIMKAFDQAVIAARSRGGVIDEGNMIYLTQIGINGSTAQKDVLQYLMEENDMLKQGVEPSFDNLTKFLTYVAKKFEGCAKGVAKHKGMDSPLSEFAALKEGDKRLLKVV